MRHCVSKLRSCIFEHLSVPCCLNEPPLLHRNKIAKNYFTKIPFLQENQEFSSGSFPHVFKAIRPLEKILEPKNGFFSFSKKVVFRWSRIWYGKMRKNETFLTHFSNIDLIWGKPRFWKITFLPLVSSITFELFWWKSNLSVAWWFWNFQFCPFCQCYRPSKSMF